MSILEKKDGDSIEGKRKTVGVDCTSGVIHQDENNQVPGTLQGPGFKEGANGFDGTESVNDVISNRMNDIINGRKPK